MSMTTRSRQPRIKQPVSSFAVVAIILIALIAVLVIVPIIQMLVRVFFPEGVLSLEVFAQVAELPGVWEMLRNTGIIIITAAFLALVIGSVFAWLNERTDARMSWVSEVLPVVPLLIPGVAISIGWVFLTSPQAGIINVGLRNMLGMEGDGPFNIFSWPGMIFLYTIELVPFAYLTVSAALRNLDPSIEEMSRISGRGPISTLFRITLPAVKPALAGATLLLVVMGMAIFSVPSIIGNTARIDVLSVTIVRLLTVEYPPRTDEAIVLSTVILVVVGTAWLYQRRVQGAGRFSTVGGRSARNGQPIELGAWRLPARLLIGAYIAVATIIPVCGLILVALQPYWAPAMDVSKMSFDAFESIFGVGSQTREAIFNSVGFGAIGATVGTAIATIVIVFLRRNTGILAKLVDGITKLPGTLSHIVIAVGLLIFLGGAPFSLYGTALILLIGYVVIHLPTATISAASAANQVGHELEEASRVSGASPGRTLRKVSLPIMIPGLVAGWAMLFVVMAGDLTASALLSAPRTPVAGFMILQLWENGTYPLIAAFSLVMTAVSCTVVISVLLLSRRLGVGKSRSKTRRVPVRVQASPDTSVTD